MRVHSPRQLLHTAIQTAAIAAIVLLAPGRATAQEITLGPYLQNVTADAITVVWEQSEPSTPVVRYGVGALDEQVATTESGTRHEVRIDGLTPSTTYDYQVVSGESALSERLTFPTAVGPDEAFRFIVFGDTRNRHDVHADVIEAMAAEEGVRFYVQTGDLVADGEVPEQWDTYFEIETPLMSRIPMFPVIGNHDEHDGDAAEYLRRFAAPINSPSPELFYSFDYGNVHIVALDGHTENALPWFDCVSQRDIWIDDCFSEEQETWLREDIEGAARDASIDHILVVIHIGPFSSKEGRSGNGQMRRLLPFFREMGVTAILSGHDHYYERGTSGNGIPYIITGGGGAPLYEVAEPSIHPHEVAFNESIENYVVVDVDGSEMTLTAKTPGGRVLDSFSVEVTTECEEAADCASVEPPTDCSAPDSPACTVAGRCVFDCLVEGFAPGEDPGGGGGDVGGEGGDAGGDDAASVGEDDVDEASDDTGRGEDSGGSAVESPDEGDERAEDQPGSGENSGCSHIGAAPRSAALGWVLVLGLVSLMRRGGRDAPR